MVSLAAVEALAVELWPEAVSAAVAVPDARKGERLVLVTEKAKATRGAFSAFAKSRGAADLMVPSEIMVVSKLPLLGSGKVDLVAVGKLVQGRMAEKPAAAE